MERLNKKMEEKKIQQMQINSKKQVEGEKKAVEKVLSKPMPGKKIVLGL